MICTSTSRKRAARELPDEASIFWVVSFGEKSTSDEPKWKYRPIVVGDNLADVDIKKLPTGIPQTAEWQAWCCKIWQKKFDALVENTKQAKLDAVRLKIAGGSQSKGLAGFVEDERLQEEILNIWKPVSEETLKKHCRYLKAFFELGQAPSPQTLERMRDQARLTGCEMFASGWWYAWLKDTFQYPIPLPSHLKGKVAPGRKSSWMRSWSKRVV